MMIMINVVGFADKLLRLHLQVLLFVAGCLFVYEN